MSRYFCTDPPVPIAEFDPAETISDTPPNIIWIKAKMDVETRGKVNSELFTVDTETTTIDVRVGANETALLLHNIVRWEGPDLGAIPCTHENIRRLDRDEPHITRVLEEIAVRNKAKPSPNPKSPAPAGFTSAGGANSIAPMSPPRPDDESTSLSLQLATGVSRSPLRSALDGRRSKSDGSIPTT